MTKDEALKLTLEALEEYVNVVVSVNDPNEWTPKVADAGEPARKAITAIKEALAQPEQEPVAWVHHLTFKNLNSFERSRYSTTLAKKQTDACCIPLYTTPPQRKPLSDEEIILIVAECASSHQHTDIHFARAIEAALRSKNT